MCVLHNNTSSVVFKKLQKVVISIAYMIDQKETFSIKIKTLNFRSNGSLLTAPYLIS